MFLQENKDTQISQMLDEVIKANESDFKRRLIFDPIFNKCQIQKEQQKIAIFFNYVIGLFIAYVI